MLKVVWDQHVSWYGNKQRLRLQLVMHGLDEWLDGFFLYVIDRHFLIHFVFWVMYFHSNRTGILTTARGDALRTK